MKTYENLYLKVDGDYWTNGKRAICNAFVKRELKRTPESVSLTISKEPFEGCKQIKVKCTGKYAFMWARPRSSSFEVFFGQADIELDKLFGDVKGIYRLYYKLYENIST